MPKVLKINSPRFLRDERYEHGSKASFKLITSMEIMKHPHNVCLDHIPASLEENHRKTIRTWEQYHCSYLSPPLTSPSPQTDALTKRPSPIYRVKARPSNLGHKLNSSENRFS
jgi:hypothetical protein